MARYTKNVENEEWTPQDLEYGQNKQINKTENHGKWEAHIVGLKMRAETLKNVTNRKLKL